MYSSSTPLFISDLCILSLSLNLKVKGHLLASQIYLIPNNQAFKVAVALLMHNKVISSLDRGLLTLSNSSLPYHHQHTMDRGCFLIAGSTLKAVSFNNVNYYHSIHTLRSFTITFIFSHYSQSILEKLRWFVPEMV